MSKNKENEAGANAPLRKGEATRAAILNSAARRFAEKGYADCSLRDIAALTGLKAGSVYYHFPSKEDLLDEVLKTGSEQLMQAVQENIGRLPENATPTEKLRTLIRSHVTCFLDVRDDANTFLRIYEYLPPVMKRRTRTSRLAYAKIWYDIFDEGVENGEFSQHVDKSTFIPFLLQSLNGIIEWFSPSRMTIDGICEMIERLLLEGISVREPEQTVRTRARSAR